MGSEGKNKMRASAGKSRGALSQPPGRFEPSEREFFDDGWTREDEPAAPLETTVTEERARSIIARNASPDVPFEQSINPYRGCEHGCIYCLSGDTPILMADGSTRPLAAIRAGDEVYGTMRQGRQRRYSRSRVLAHWSVVKPAYRITLRDGTHLIAGPDHRLLTQRGWRFVTGAGPGRTRRPLLSNKNRLMGVGNLGSGPEKNDDYRLGYLCGVMRGDASAATPRSRHAGSSTESPHPFRLPLCDAEALLRAQDYLLRRALDAQPSRSSRAAAGTSLLHAPPLLRGRWDADPIPAPFAFPDVPSREWSAGFLAAIFDTEGSYRDGVLRIAHGRREWVAWISRCLRTLEFRFVIEHARGVTDTPIDSVCLRGELREQLRFFHSVDPAVTRKRDITGRAVTSEAPLAVAAIEPLGKAMRLYDITTQTGDYLANGVVSHNCYARPSHAYLELSPGLDFETKLFAKVNAAELLRAELARPGYRCSPIAFGANTDCYQPLERRSRVTRSLIEVLAACEHPFTVVTKSALVERDLDLLAPMAAKNLVKVFVSLGMLQRALARRLEPRAASPQRRLDTIRALARAGVPVGVMVAPVIPALTDTSLEASLEAAAAAGATMAGYTLLRLPHEVKGLFREWLTAYFPQRAEHVMSIVRQIRGGRENDPRFGTRMTGTGNYAELIARRFEIACRRLGLNGAERGQKARRELDCTRFRPPATPGAQLALF